MVKLSRVNVAKRLVVVLLCASMLLAGTFFAAKLIKTIKTNAITADGDSVSISYIRDGTSTKPNREGWVNYENESGVGNGWSSPMLSVTPEGGSAHMAFCLNPNILAPPESSASSSYPYTASLFTDSTTNTDNIANRIKLAIFIATAPSSNETATEIKNGWNWTNSSTLENLNPNWADHIEPASVANYRYILTHALVGYLYDSTQAASIWDHLTAGEQTWVENTATQLGNFITSNADIWLMAQNYRLYGLDMSVFPSGSNYQNIAWIEDASTYGDISVQKCDAEAEPICNLSATTHPTAGNGSLQGITFEVYNASGSRIYNPSNGEFYDNNTSMASAVTNASGVATFSNLPTGINYSIKEVAQDPSSSISTNGKYLISSDTKRVNNLTTEGAKIAFSNFIVRGDVTFRKVDEDGNPMANVAFAITSNTTGERHVVVTDDNGVVDTSSDYISHTTGTNGYDSITSGSYIHQDYGTWFYGMETPPAQLEDWGEGGALPYDEYTLTELECDANKFCSATGSSISFEITQEGETVALQDISNDCAEFGISTSAADTTDGDKFVEASTTASITDTITYCAKAGLAYTIQGSLMYTDGNPVTIAGVPVQQEITDTPANDCGNIATMTFELDTSELAGKSIVVFEKLLYNGEVVADHSNPNDTDQTVTIISLDTYALDKSDSDKEVLATEDATVTDHIKYCLVAGTEYTIMGTLMNKITGEPVTINNGPIWNTTSLTPEENCGDLYLDFEFDATGLGGTEVVVFESAGITSPTQLSDDDMCLGYDTDIIGEDGNPTCTSYFHSVISHADIDDVAQTVLVSEPDAPKAADTGRLTSATDSSKNGTSGILLGGVSVLVVATGYFGIRLFSRKRFLGKAK